MRSLIRKLINWANKEGPQPGKSDGHGPEPASPFGACGVSQALTPYGHPQDANNRPLATSDMVRYEVIQAKNGQVLQVVRVKSNPNGPDQHTWSIYVVPDGGDMPTTLIAAMAADRLNK